MRFVGLIMAFLVVVVLAFLSIGFISTQSAPDPVNDTAAYNQYTNLSRTTDIAYSGVNGGLLLLLLAIIIAALWMIIRAIG